MKGILLLVAYGTVMLVATNIFARKGTASEDFHVGDRHMGVFATAMSVAATWIWAPALFTSAEKAYTSGWPGLFWFLVPNVSCLLLFIPFAKKIRERMPRGITLSGFDETVLEAVGGSDFIARRVGVTSLTASCEGFSFTVRVTVAA